MKEEQKATSGGGKFIQKSTINKMISNYREGGAAKQKLRYSHFSLEKVIDLFVNNGIIDPEIPLSLQKENIAKHGLKLHMGRHDETTCLERPDYVGMDAIILVNTASSVDKVSGIDNRWDCDDWGLDMAYICPPDCTNEFGVCETEATFVSQNSEQ